MAGVFGNAARSRPAADPHVNGTPQCARRAYVTLEDVENGRRLMPHAAMADRPLGRVASHGQRLTSMHRDPLQSMRDIGDGGHAAHAATAEEQVVVNLPTGRRYGEHTPSG